MQIDAQFPGGNAQLVGEVDGRLQVAIRSDVRARFRQWFCFRASGPRARPWRFTVINAGRATYPDTWDGHRVCASYDGLRWFRVATRFDGEALTFSLSPSHPTCLFAYFALYPEERRQRLRERCARTPWMRREQAATTVQGREVELYVVGAPGEGQRRVWITASQHPGETMGEWLADGLLERLGDVKDPLVPPLLDRAVFYVVPNMNPDGAALGNHRTNAAGADLNRSWMAPTRAKSPEVLGVRARMKRVGVDLFLDIHGDERNPYLFLSGCEGNPGYSERLRYLENLFEQALAGVSPDFEEGHEERDPPGRADGRIAAAWVGRRFDCLAMTVEQPFRRAHERRAPEWSPERARLLGRHLLDAIAVTLDDLR